MTSNLYQLKPGALAEIVELEQSIPQQQRRRLIDLGFLPGTKIQTEIDNPFGGIKAYMIRGTLVSLRSDQSKKIKIEIIDETKPDTIK